MTTAAVPRLGDECAGCGQVDDHPKHHVVVGAQLQRGADGKFVIDPESGQPVLQAVLESYHLDCHAECGPCETQLAHADGAHGLELAAVLSDPPTEMLRALALDHDVNVEA